MNPKVLILDEPTAGLDQEGKATILKELGRFSSDGRTVVVISHDIEELLRVTNRLLFIEGGKIAADGPSLQVLEKISERKERLRMLPFVTELMVVLNERGLHVRRNVYEPDEAFREIRRALDI